MPNPIVPQGTLNRLRGSITFPGFTQLNITAPFLGKEGIGITFSGVVNTPLEAMTGVVQSPEPYQRVTFSAHLLKSQSFANRWKTQVETLALIGDATIRLDSVKLDPYLISNTAIDNVSPLKSDGQDPHWIIMFSGTYYVNSALYNM